MSVEPTRERPDPLRPRDRARDDAAGRERRDAAPRDPDCEEAPQFAYSREIDPDAHADEQHRSAEVVSRNLMKLFDFDC